MSRHSVFNNLLQTTADIVFRRFPSDRDIDYARSRLDVAISMSPRLPVLHFMDNIDPYRKYIKRRDEVFFLGAAKSDDTLKCFNLGEKWEQLSDEDKELLWGNVTKMVSLGDKIVSEIGA